MISGGPSEGMPSSSTKSQQKEQPNDMGNASLISCESDAIFDKIIARLDTDSSTITGAVGKRAVQFAITIPHSNQIKVYVLDFCSPEKPSINQYASLIEAKRGRSGQPTADVTITVSDNDFMKLCSGDLSAEWAYATGKMQVDGSMGVALKMKQLLDMAGKL